MEVRVAATEAAGQLELVALSPLLVAAAASPELRLRQATIEALARIQPADVEEARPVEASLVRALGDTDLGVRLSALAGLASRRSLARVAVIEAIGACLTDERPDLRRAAAEALEALADPLALHALAARIDDPSPEVRVAVAHALGVLGDPRAASMVLRLGTDAAEEVRAAAFSTLGLLRAETATAMLVSVLERSRDPLAGPAALALGRIAGGGPRDASVDPVAKKMRAHAAAALVSAAQRPDARAAAAEGIRVSGPAAVAIFRALLPPLGPRADDELLLLARELVAGGDAVLCQLLLEGARLATDARFDVALVAARPPGGPVRDALVAWLAVRLGDPAPAARRGAAEALAAIADPRAARALEDAARDGDANVRRASVLALVKSAGSPEAVLLGAARGSDLELARAATTALGKRHDEPARQALLAALSSSDVATTQLAASSLAIDAGATSLVPALLALLKAGTPPVREAAALALLGPLRGRPDAVARELCLSLAVGDGVLGAAALELLGAMRDVSSGERLASLVPRLARRPLRRARLYAALGDLLLVDHGAGIERAVTTGLADTDAGVRASAAWALGKSHAPVQHVTVTALQARLADTSAAVRANALGALGRLARMPDESTLAALRRDREPAVRANAAITSTRRGADYVLVRAPADARATIARVGLPDGRVEILLADERGLLRDEGVPSGDLSIDLDDTLLR